MSKKKKTKSSKPPKKKENKAKHVNISSSKNLNRAQRRLQEKLRNFQFSQQVLQPSTAVDYESLNSLKNEYQPLIDQANERISRLMLHGYWSQAMENLFARGVQEFDTSSIRTSRELSAYITQVKAFLNDSGSTLEGARYEMAMMSSAKFIDSFGSQWEDKINNKRVNYDTSSIDPNLARQSFSTYRKLEEEYGPIISRKGAGTPIDSDKLIALIYDSVVQGEDISTVRQILEDWRIRYRDYVSGRNEFKSGLFRIGSGRK